MRVILVLLCTLFCVSCGLLSQKVAAPVVNSTPYDIKHDTVHTVRRGDTLYTIAWQYGLDYHALAKANNLRSPDHIVVGQAIRLNIDAANANKSTWRKSIQRIQEIKKPTSQPITWSWPVKGPILKQYGVHQAQANKGIDIGGSLGKPVRAAAGGTVVYAGSGLRGYGQLIIIRHNEAYLSAYAHNKAIEVREGESVRLGQIIARMGKTDTQQVKLHFEIRHHGAPIDPLSKLPALK